jgi:hypothetical protein
VYGGNQVLHYAERNIFETVPFVGEPRNGLADVLHVIVEIRYSKRKS